MQRREAGKSREAYVCVEKARRRKRKYNNIERMTGDLRPRECVCFFLPGTGSCGINHGGSQLSREGEGGWKEIYATADPKKRGICSK